MGRWGFFVILYFVQGVALAYFTGFQKRYLSSVGVNADWIGILTSLVLLPFILKPIIGLIADSWQVPRRLAIAAGLGIAAAAFGSGMLVTPSQENFKLFGALMILASLGVAIFDTMADALAVDSFASDDYGPLQSAMLAGKSLGLILFSVVFGFLIDQDGYQNVFFYLGIFMLLPFVLWRALRAAPRRETFRWSAFVVLKKPQVIAVAAFAVLYSIPSFGISGLFSYYYSQHGASASQIGWLEASKSIGAVVGALSFAFLTRRVTLLKIGVVATLAAVLASAVVPLYDGVLIYIGIASFGLIWALRETFFTTLAMRITQPAIAATMFSLLMAFSNIGTSIGEGWATAAAGRRGFVFVFVVFGLLNLLSLPLLTKVLKANDHGK